MLSEIPLPTCDMALHYQESGRLSNVHTAGVSCLVFHPNGTLLASGGLDGIVSIWDVRTMVPLHMFVGTCPVLSLAWQSTGRLYGGLQDGSLIAITLTVSLTPIESPVNLTHYIDHKSVASWTSSSLIPVGTDCSRSPRKVGIRRWGRGQSLEIERRCRYRLRNRGP